MSQSTNATQSDAPDKERSYRKTLNLPKTSFPMRASLIQNEPASMKRWDKMKLYDRVLEARKKDLPENKGPWAFHDGPPYANGSIHLGHLLNKVLKDLVVRSKSIAGYTVPFTPGWDCHGLPIEHKVMAGLVDSGKYEKLATLEDNTRRLAIRKECKKSAEKFIKLQRGQMQRLLTHADYPKPYLTMNPSYEADVLSVFADMVKQGLVYRDLKPVHWSIANQTALADAELEYQDREDTSVFVNFEVANVSQLSTVFGVDEAEIRSAATKSAALMIWTTTPWTLPANLAVAVHPRLVYVLVVLDDRPTVLAEGLVSAVADARGFDVDTIKILGKAKGSELTSLRYQHSFCDRVSPVVEADYVTLEDGTGLVHTAPGHGTEDYQTGLSNGLDIYCPVLHDGTFDNTVPDFLVGKSVWEANDLVVECLKASGNLYFSHTFTHSYPHDWRSKTPVIFRATEQWFVTVSKPLESDPKSRSLQELALDVTRDNVAFHPEWGRNRMRGMLESRPDWCLSRQRSWGLPIPAFVTPDGDVVLTEAIVKAVSDQFRIHGSDMWYRCSAAEILSEYNPSDDPDVLDDLDVSTLDKMQDIFDVWFESGSSWNNVMKQSGAGYPIELYLEGSDQHRGWFQLSLLCGLGSTQQSPFKAVLTHGFTVDKDGHKMSKSIGNTVEVEDLLKDFGADVCRWWVAGLNFENDIKADLEYFRVAGEAYRKVRNTLRFLLSNLSDFDMDATPTPSETSATCNAIASTSIDAWVLGEYNKMATRVMCAYNEYEFKTAQNAIYNFCNDTLSSVYCAAVKDRLYCDRVDSPRRIQTQNTMAQLLDGLVRLIAPILPHTADEAYRALWNVDRKDMDVCVHLQTFIESYNYVTPHDSWAKVMFLRDEVLRVLEQARASGVIDNPLDAAVVIADDGWFTTLCQEANAQHVDFIADFADLLGVSRVSIVDDTTHKTQIVSLADKPRCERSWKRDDTVCERSDGGMLSDRDAEAIGLMS